MSAERHHLSDLRTADEGPAFPVVTGPAIDGINAEEVARLPLTMREIAQAVAASWELSLDDLKGPARQRRIAHPRQEAFAQIHAQGRYSLTQIGQFFGGRDHTTVLSGLRAYAARQSEGRGE